MPSQSYYYHYTRQLEVGRVDDRIVSYKANNKGDAFMLQALKYEGNQEQQFTIFSSTVYTLNKKQASRLPFIGSLEALCFILILILF